MTIKNVKFTTPVTGSSDSPTIIEGTVEQDGDNVVLMAEMTVRDLLEQILIELKEINEILNNGDL